MCSEIQFGEFLENAGCNAFRVFKQTISKISKGHSNFNNSLPVAINALGYISFRSLGFYKW